MITKEPEKAFKPTPTQFRPFPLPEDAVMMLEFIRKNPGLYLEEETASEIVEYMGDENAMLYGEMLKRLGLVTVYDANHEYRYTAIERKSVEEIAKDTKTVYEYVKNNPDLCWGDAEYCKYRRLSVTIAKEPDNTGAELDQKDKDRILKLIRSESDYGIDILMIQLELDIKFASIYQYLRSLYKAGIISEEDKGYLLNYYTPEDRAEHEKWRAENKAKEEQEKKE
jgi:DNA-binding transcriptional ArsR family regulator